MLTISVIIPAYNRARLIEHAVASAFGQTRPPLEVIVVDDASADSTRELVESMARAEPRLRGIFLDRNGGPSAARNRGIAEARGDLVAFLDSDDAWREGHLEACARFLEDDPGLDVVFADQRVIRPDGSVVCPSMAQRRGIERFLERVPAAPDRYVFRVPEVDAIIEQYFLGIQAAVVRREAAARHAFDEDLRVGEDLLFFARLALSGCRFGHVDAVGCDMLIHDQNLMSNNNDPMRDVRSWGRAMAKLRGAPGLAPRQRRALARQIADCQFVEGYINYRRGMRIGAVAAYLRSARTRVSLRAARGALFALILPYSLVRLRHPEPTPHPGRPGPIPS